MSARQIRVELRTDDTRWIADNATPGRDGRYVTDAVEVDRRTTGTGQELVTFVLVDWPRDGARVGFAPAEWVVG